MQQDIIKVNQNQKGNPILKYVRKYQFENDIAPDYVIGQSACCLYLSLKYHSLHPEYIFTRFRELGPGYKLRIWLILVDIEDSSTFIRELTSLSITYEMSMVLAWSQEDAGRYLEGFKNLEHKPPDVIKEKLSNPNNSLSIINSALTKIKGINKTDVVTLTANYGVFVFVIISLVIRENDKS